MFKTIFKISTAAFAIIGLLVCLVIAGLIWFASSRMHDNAPKPPEKIVLVLDFRDELTEISDEMPSLHSLLNLGKHENGSTNLHDVVQSLRTATKDPRVVGVVGLFGPNSPHMTETQEIRAALEPFRAAGKFSIAYSPSYGEFGPGNNAYYMASAFEKVWLQPVGNLGLAGMRMENPFGRNVLDKIGVKASFLQREEYKSALTFATEDKMPVAMREEMQTILDSLSNQQVDGMAKGRGLKPEDIKALMATGPYTAKEALEHKLIDKIAYSDEVEKFIDDAHGKKTAKMRPAQYLAIPEFVAKDKKPVANNKPKATVALIVAAGEITDGPGGGPSPLSGGKASMDTREIVEAFEDAVEDTDVKQIIFRVDSPGGSPTASETIRRAVIRAKEQGKKVVVSMGQMAGSGGYWIAMDADHIIANPATLTGSIGVLGGKIDLSGLYEKIGLNWEVLQAGADLSGMWSSTHGYTPAERERMDALLDDTYNSFRENVSKARKIPMDKMPSVSKGRVFTGEQAIKLGLVDELGGLRTAVDYTKTSLGLNADDLIELKHFPKHVSTAERVRDAIKALFGYEAQMPMFNITMLNNWMQRSFQPRMVMMSPMRIE
jgi:protease-4